MFSKFLNYIFLLYMYRQCLWFWPIFKTLVMFYRSICTELGWINVSNENLDFYIHSSYINTCTYTQNLTQSALYIRTFHVYTFYILLNMGHKISRIWFMGLWLTDTISHGSIFVFFDDLFKITSLNSIEMCSDFIYSKLFHLKL